MSEGLPSYADRLCSPCRAAMERSIADGTRRSSVCNDCADRLLEGARVVKTETVGGDSPDIVGTPLEFAESPMSAPVDHPPPWAWRRAQGVVTGPNDGLFAPGMRIPGGWSLVDATGRVLIDKEMVFHLDDRAGLRALIAAAPEMERLLRDILEIPAMFREALPATIHEISALLARLDEARRG